MRSIISKIFIIVLVSLTSIAYAQNFTPAQKTEINQMVHDYILNNPKVLIEAGQRLQQKQITEGINSVAPQLFGSGTSPVIGDPKATEYLVEFFDYQCGHCKTMTKAMNALIKANPNVKFVFKEFPIFGANSIYAAKAALASQLQNKYLAFHTALMATQGKMNQEKVLTAAKSAGLNVAQLQKDMQNPVYERELKTNMEIASILGLGGTPAFIIGQYPNKNDKAYVVIPGATNQANLQQAIDKLKS